MSTNRKLVELQNEIESLKAQLTSKEIELAQLSKFPEVENQQSQSDKLTKSEIARYSRQLILPEIGICGQLKLKASSILIVGIGGLGCPAAQYLAGAGIGTIGLLDYDDVELNNLHRQLLHSELSIGKSKTESAANLLVKINSNTKIHTHQIQLTSKNALDIIEPYDIVLDATDNVATRYLLNDACVLLKKPLVSGSALQLEGQLTVYNCSNGPCYRCIFPLPPPPEAVTNCGDGGVIGAVPGVIGILQALEAIKIILKFDGVLSGRLLIFDGCEGIFRSVRLRHKSSNCVVCSNTPTLTTLIDYEQFCGMRSTDKDYKLSVLTENERISARDYSNILKSNISHTLIDVRNSNEFQICSIQSSINIPIKVLLDERYDESLIQDPVYIVCRRGNDSQLAVKHLQLKFGGKIQLKDIIGGLHAWALSVDCTFPIY